MPHVRGQEEELQQLQPDQGCQGGKAAANSASHNCRAPVQTAHLDRRQRHARKKDIQKKLDQWDRGAQDRCHWSFVFDPAGRLCYYWSMVVSLAVLYNFWVILYRFSFAEISVDTIVVWFSLDYLMDLIYLMDIVFHFRTGYLEDGVLQTDSVKLRQHYMNTTTFYVDCLCLLPLDFLYLSLGFKSILRIFRLVKIYQLWTFLDRSERHTNYPNLLRFVALVHYLLLAFHWNACLFHLVYRGRGFGRADDARSAWSELRLAEDADEATTSEATASEATASEDTLLTYLKCYYWTVLVMTTVGDLPQPVTKAEYLFVIFQLMCGLMAFATVLGYIANIVTNVSAARKDFQAKLDGVKTYMRLRRVPNGIQNKVIKWFDYLWLTQKSSDEERAISCLPDKLKGEIAIHVHLDTLKRVEIFQNTEAGFLCELVLRLRPVLFSPGDYICRKGEVGKEMYICARGRLEVVADEGKTILATLKAGSYFGEISILNMGTAGNRRTASVRSVGYSDLFVLSKKDMWDVLKDYPAARVRLEAIAVKRLEKYKKAPLEKAALPRSESTPGLVESSGMIPLAEMWVSPLPYVPMQQHNSHTSPESGSRGRGVASNESPVSDLSSSRSQSTLGGHRHHRHQRNNARTHTDVRAPGPQLTVICASPSAASATEAGPPGLPPGLPPGWPSSAAARSPTPSSERSAAHWQSTQTATNAGSYNGGSATVLQASNLRYPRYIPQHHIHSSGVVASASSVLGSSSEELQLEIKNLRERIRLLETDNASMHTQLNKTQKDVDDRLAEIKLHMADDDNDDEEEEELDLMTSQGGSATSSVNCADDEEEKNIESFI